MRALYPEEIQKERAALFFYMEYREKEGWVIKSDAPAGIKSRHEALRRKILKFDSQCR